MMSITAIFKLPKKGCCILFGSSSKNNKTKFANAMGMKQVQDSYSYLGSKNSIMKSQKSRDKLRSLGINPAWYEFGEGSPFIDHDNPTTEYTNISSLISTH